MKNLDKSAEKPDNESSHEGASNAPAALTTRAAKDSDRMADSDSTPGRSPAFQFYPKDFLSDENVRVMSLQERGVYITLLCLCWIQGSLPAGVERLAKLCGVPVNAMRKLWPAILPCFRDGDPDRLIHPRLEREREKQAHYKRRQSDAAAKRWQSHGNATALPADVPQPSQRNALHSSSAFASADLRHTNTARARERMPSDDPDLAERAGRFLERYAEMYPKFRKGARYLGKPSLDFQEALQLVATWDDDRLDKLATVFLTTDHEFAEKGSRSVAQFRSMASWCDGRLAEAGLV